MVFQGECGRGPAHVEIAGEQCELLRCACEFVHRFVEPRFVEVFTGEEGARFVARAVVAAQFFVHSYGSLVVKRAHDGHEVGCAAFLFERGY